jgi:murein DD-endopeptidase MepM/ murein hydrolase activator NlpD
VLEKKTELGRGKIIFFFLVSVFSTIYALQKFYYFDRFSFLPPLDKISVRVDSRGNGWFGAARRGKRWHNGIDLSAKMETPVKAAMSGLAYCSEVPTGMGKFVILKHARGLSTLYGHLSNIYIKNGQMVRQGQIIASVGKTGNARHPRIMPHLHFEIKKDGVIVDPAADYLYLTN